MRPARRIVNKDIAPVCTLTITTTTTITIFMRVRLPYSARVCVCRKLSSAVCNRSKSAIKKNSDLEFLDPFQFAFPRTWRKYESLTLMKMVIVIVVAFWNQWLMAWLLSCPARNAEMPKLCLWITRSSLVRSRHVAALAERAVCRINGQRKTRIPYGRCGFSPTRLLRPIPPASRRPRQCLAAVRR